MPAPLKYTRVLLKLSGEVMAGDEKFGIDAERVKALAVSATATMRASIGIASAISPCGYPLPSIRSW